jgi:hypothetical protein
MPVTGVSIFRITEGKLKTFAVENEEIGMILPSQASLVIILIQMNG